LPSTKRRFILKELVLEYDRLNFILAARVKLLLSNRNLRPAAGALPYPTFIPSANVAFRFLGL
jgi:hypothetical protein